VTTYDNLFSLVSPLITAYRDDLEKHDREAIESHPGVPFLHWTREMGTHLTMLIPASEYPAAGERVPFLFGHADREHILNEGTVRFAEYFLKKFATPHVCHYYDGRTVKQVSLEQALVVARTYRQRIQAQWAGKAVAA